MNFGVQIILLLWQIISSGVRVFAIDSVRSGLVDVRPLRPSGKLLIIIGFMVTVAFLAATIFSTFIRTAAPLEALAISSSTARGLLVPSLAIPVTLCGLVLAWGFVLTGALRMHITARLVAYGSFLLFGTQALSSGLTTTSMIAATEPLLSTMLSLAGWATFAALGAALLILPRLKFPQALDFAIVLALVTLYTLPGLAALARSAESAMQMPTGRADSISDALFLTAVLLTPFRMISGMELANLAQSLSSAAVQAVRRHMQPGPLLLLTLLVLALRLGGAAQRTLISAAPDWQKLLGAAVLVTGVSALALLYRRRRAERATPFPIIVLAIVAFTAFNMTLIPLMQASVSALVAVGVGTGNLQTITLVVDAVLTRFNQVSDFYSMYSLVLLAVGAAIAAALLWRRRSEVSSFLAALAWLALWRWVTGYDQPLAALRWEFEHLDLIVLLTLAILFTARAARKQLDVDFSARILGVVILFAVLHQTNFLDNPFSPLSGLASVIILAVGIAWNVITSGGRFLNADSPQFPRMSRALMYFGYVMLMVCVTFWFVISHTVWQQSLGSNITRTGFELFGIAVVLFVLVNGAESLDGADEV